jgi:hypothetical protein
VHGRQRGLRRRLQHDAVPGDERGGQLASRRQQGVVPRCDEDDDTERLATDERVHSPTAVGEDLALADAREAPVVLEERDRGADLRARLRQGLAHLGGDVRGDVVAAVGQDLRRGQEDLAPFEEPGAPPGGEPLPRRGERRLGIGRGHRRVAHDDLGGVGGVGPLEGLAG